MRFKTIFFAIIIFLFLVVSPCIAAEKQLEQPLPDMTGTNLLDYVNTVFKLIMGIAGALAFLMLVVGGITYLTSAGSPEKIGEAKKTITSALLGLGLLLSSYIIMSMINPELKNIKLHEIKRVTLPGVYLTSEDGKTKKEACPISVFDTDSLDQDLKKLLIDCPEEEKGTIFVLSKYNDVGLRGTATSIILNCDSKPQEITSAKSFKIFKKLPGVYFYTDAGCNDISSATRKTSSVGSFGENFKKSINCLEISNGPNEQYGFILFKKNSGFKGEFNYENLNEIACYPQAAIRPYRISLENYSAIAIYKINEDPKSAGSSVEFYSQANSSGISKTITAGDIKIKMQATVSEKAYWLAKKIIFDDTNAIEKNRCKSEDTRWQGAFSICAGSMNINGKYLVLLRSSDPTITGGKDYYCQLFTSNDLWSVSGQTDHHKAAATMTYNLEAEYIISKSWAGKNDSLDDVFIIPVYSF